MSSPDRKTENVRVRLEPELRAELERQASAERRPLSNLMRVAAEEYLERHAPTERS